MKVRHLIRTVVVIILTLHFVASGLIGFQGNKSDQIVSIEKTMQTVDTQEKADSLSAAEEDTSIFSNTILFSLVVVVAGVVAFRRDMNS